MRIGEAQKATASTSPDTSEANDYAYCDILSFHQNSCIFEKFPFLAENYQSFPLRWFVKPSDSPAPPGNISWMGNLLRGVMIHEDVNKYQNKTK